MIGRLVEVRSNRRKRQLVNMIVSFSFKKNIRATYETHTKQKYCNIFYYIYIFKVN